MKEVVRLIEPLYQFSSLLIYPLFYIYFRLLFIEKVFSFRNHGLFLLLPLVIALLHLVAVLIVPKEVFLDWLYKNHVQTSHPSFAFLNVLSMVVLIVYILQVVGIVWANLRLIRMHRKKARNYYSDWYQIDSRSVVILNIMLVVCAVVSIVLRILGRNSLVSEMTGIILASVIFSTMLFVIGWMGFKQNAVEQNLEENADDCTEPTVDVLYYDQQQLLMEKISRLFCEERIFLNNKLTVQDVAQAVGTNRTYVSSAINQQFGINFCAYVNNYRLDELGKVVRANPHATNQVLAEECGFGSIDSLKRAIHARSGLTVSQWKSNLLNRHQGI